MGGCRIIGVENINGDDSLYSSMISEDKRNNIQNRSFSDVGSAFR